MKAAALAVIGVLAFGSIGCGSATDASVEPTPEAIVSEAHLALTGRTISAEALASYVLEMTSGVTLTAIAQEIITAEQKIDRTITIDTKIDISAPTNVADVLPSSVVDAYEEWRSAFSPLHACD